MNRACVLFALFYVLTLSRSISCMDGKIVSNDQHMAQFSNSLFQDKIIPYTQKMRKFGVAYDTAHAGLQTQLSMLHSNRRARCVFSKERFDQEKTGVLSAMNHMEENIGHVSNSFKPRVLFSPQEETEELSHVATVLVCVYNQVHNMGALYKQKDEKHWDDKTAAAETVSSALGALSHIQACLDRLFSICNGVPYEASESVLTVVLDQTVSSPKEMGSVFLQALTDKKFVFPLASNFTDLALLDRHSLSETMWFERLVEQGDQYYGMGNAILAGIMDVWAKDKDDKQKMDLLFDDLSNRLCGTQSTSTLRASVHASLNTLSLICEMQCRLAPLLKGMKQENALDAHTMSEMINAALSKITQKCLKNIEGALKNKMSERNGPAAMLARFGSSAFIRMLTALNLLKQAQVEKLQRGIAMGHDHSGYIESLSRLIDDYHLEPWMQTISAILEKNSGELTPWIVSGSDHVLHGESDAAKIHAIINGPSPLEEIDKERQDEAWKRQREALAKIHGCSPDEINDKERKKEPSRWTDTERARLKGLHKMLRACVDPHESGNQVKKKNEAMLRYVAALRVAYEEPSETYQYLVNRLQEIDERNDTTLYQDGKIIVEGSQGSYSIRRIDHLIPNIVTNQERENGSADLSVSLPQRQEDVAIHDNDQSIGEPEDHIATPVVEGKKEKNWKGKGPACGSGTPASDQRRESFGSSSTQRISSETDRSAPSIGDELEELLNILGQWEDEGAGIGPSTGRSSDDSFSKSAP